MKLQELVDAITDEFEEPTNANKVLREIPKPPRRRDGFLGRRVYGPLERLEVISPRKGIESQRLEFQMSSAYLSFNRDYNNDLSAPFTAGAQVEIPLYLPGVNEAFGHNFKVPTPNYGLLKDILAGLCVREDVFPTELDVVPFGAKRFELFKTLQEGSQIEEVVELLGRVIRVARVFDERVAENTSRCVRDYNNRLERELSSM